MNRLLKAGEVAALLGVAPDWIYRQSRAGNFPAIKVGRYYRYDEEDVQRWVSAQKTEPK